MLEVIGAGATAVSDRDWNKMWIKTEGAKRLEADLDKIHTDGRQHSPIDATLSSSHAASFTYQLKELTIRQYVSYWRNPAYLMSKLILNIIAGLFIGTYTIKWWGIRSINVLSTGFSFFQAGNSQQDTQNKLFVRMTYLSIYILFSHSSVVNFHGHRFGEYFGDDTSALSDLRAELTPGRSNARPLY